MSRFKKTAFVFLFLLCLYNLHGQTNFIPGFIITNENDTLHGLVDYRGDSRNCKRCDFKENINSPTREFLPFSIQGYRFNDSKFYVSKNVLIQGKVEPVFLEFMVNGISDLFYYADGVNFHYFIEKADGQFFELTDEVRKFNRNGIEYSARLKQYVGYLKLAFADCQQLYPMINAATLDSKSLIAITKKYHDYVCDGEKCIIYEKKLPIVKVRFGAFVSMNSSFLYFKEHEGYQGVDFKMSTYPSYGLLLNTSLPRASEKLSFQLSGEFGKTYFYGTDTHPKYADFEEVHLHTSLIKVKAGFKYTYPKNKIRPTLLIGGNFIKITQSEGRRIENVLSNSTVFTGLYNDVPISDPLFGANMTTGIDFHHSPSLVSFLNLGFEYNMGKKNLARSYGVTTHINNINLHAGIYF